MRKIIFLVRNIVLFKPISAIVFLARLGCRNNRSGRVIREGTMQQKQNEKESTSETLALSNFVA